MTENAARGLTSSDRFAEPVPPPLRHVGWDELSAVERARLRRLFRSDVYPLLTPFVVDAAHPFPRIGALTLCVLLHDPADGVTRFAGVQIPSRVPRDVGLDEYRRIHVETLVGALLQDVFAGVRILERSTFRVARIEAAEGDRAVVRLEVENTVSAPMLAILIRNLGISDGQVHRVPGPLVRGAGSATRRKWAFAGDARRRSGGSQPMVGRP